MVDSLPSRRVLVVALGLASVAASAEAVNAQELPVYSCETPHPSQLILPDRFLPALVMTDSNPLVTALGGRLSKFGRGSAHPNRDQNTRARGRLWWF